MPSTLILPTAFNPTTPSLLSIPPSPHSPLSPLTPKVPRPLYIPHTFPAARRRSSVFRAHPTPSNPLPWRWQCHLCYRCYDLGITRRCLDDGHTFCSGQSCGTSPKSKRARHKRKGSKKSGKACASEFDYEGWAKWGDWRRVVERAVGTLSPPTSPPAAAGLSSKVAEDGEQQGKKKKHRKRCHQLCNYPSECRWNGNLAGPVSQSTTDTTAADASVTVEKDITDTAPTPFFAEDDDGNASIPPHLHPSTDDLSTSAKSSDTSTAPKRKHVPTSFEEILGLSLGLADKMDAATEAAKTTRRSNSRGSTSEKRKVSTNPEERDYDDYDAEPTGAQDEEDGWEDETLYSLAEGEGEGDSSSSSSDAGDQTEWSTVIDSEDEHEGAETKAIEIPEAAVTNDNPLHYSRSYDELEGKTGAKHIFANALEGEKRKHGRKWREWFGSGA